MTTKRAFYAIQEVELELKNTPKGEISLRINELILKGKEYEKKMMIKSDYAHFNKALEKEAKSEDDSKIYLSERAYTDEDNDNIEDLF